MNEKQLNALLVENFPELKEKYYEEVEWQEGDETGSHVVYGDVFTPYIEKSILEKNYIKLQKIFNFIEDILAKKEKYSDEVIAFSVLERIVADKLQFDICKKYIGEYTKMIIEEINKSWF